ncbi:MAG: hypothetical protein ACXVYI_14820 [Mycobacterium sp.]
MDAGECFGNQLGNVEVDRPRSIVFFGGLAAATGLGLIEPPLALFIAALPLYKMLTNTGLPRPVRVAGEVLESAARPVGSDVIKLQDPRDSETTVIPVPPGNRRRAR